VLIDRRNLARHWPWLVFLILVTIAATVWHSLSSRNASNWPGGGSPSGLTFGIVGGLLILFEFALWGRKKVRSWRIGRVQDWMIAHIWLGLLTIPLLLLHTGFRWGGSLSTVLLILFLSVIASGIWGLILQQVLPTRMLHQIPAETIHSQIDRVVRFMIADARRLVSTICGPISADFLDETEKRAILHGLPVSHLTVGAVQTVGRVQGKILITQVPHAAIPGSEPLSVLYLNSIEPYLLSGNKSQSPLILPNKSALIFQELKKKLSPETHDAISLLENLCDQRRQLDRQRQLHHWLHLWLIIHVPLSAGLVVLMLFHIWIALKYR